MPTTDGSKEKTDAFGNTVTDKGGTEFPFQNVILSATKGDLALWPAEFTHPHKGIISPTQEKYIATGWFELI